MINQKGYTIQIVLIVFAILIGIMIFPLKFPTMKSSGEGGSQYCREFINDPNPPTFEYEGVTYKLVKQNVPVNPGGFQGGHHVGQKGDIVVDGGNFRILNPQEGAGRSYDFNTDDGVTDITFSDFGLIYLQHLDDSNNPDLVEIQKLGYPLIDIYQDVSKPAIQNAQNILKCIDVGATAIINPKVIVPAQNASENRDQLQLEWFILKQSKLLPKAWWTPECKPAVYLYPKRRQLVNVKVFPKGELSYTDPPYNKETGWTVWADPRGGLSLLDSSSISSGYLYYESRLLDNEIKKPSRGWVIKQSEMQNLFDEILPKLGLNKKEEKDFKDYWLEKLPESAYYFVGLIEKEQRDYLERLDVTPNPDTSIRFSLYFQMLDEPIVVEEPLINTPKREGFTLVDWGGMIKLHKDTPFTCSQ